MAIRPWLPALNKKIFMCMSGGVDSSVTARILYEKGYKITPVFMRNWDTLDEQSASGGCEWEKDFEDVARLCREQLGGCEPRLVDLSKQYWTNVFEPSLDEWATGITPNPDVRCNEKIKFEALPYALGIEEQDAWIATGHYAQVGASPNNPAEPALFRGAFPDKDQSYYLSTVSVDVLRRTLFPLGGMPKAQVREFAKNRGMHISEKKESMGICFVGVRKRFDQFLESYLKPQPGDIINENGLVLGQHQGLWTYTVGERARISGCKEKMFIAHKNTTTNTITIAPASSPLLKCVAVHTNDFKWISKKPFTFTTPFRAEAQTRSRAEGALEPCTVHSRKDGSWDILLDSPIVGVSPGQNVVLYHGIWCLGGGTIATTTTAADQQPLN